MVRACSALSPLWAMVAENVGGGDGAMAMATTLITARPATAPPRSVPRWKSTAPRTMAALAANRLSARAAPLMPRSDSNTGPVSPAPKSAPMVLAT
jgi:hypothetical protein